MQNSLNVEHHPPQKFNRYDTQIVRFEPSVFKQPAPLQMFIEERQCSICNSADTTVVFLLCKHQLSCRVCWESAKKGERAVHNTNERLRIQLAGAGVKRVARIQRASAQRSAGLAHDRARRRTLHGSTRRPDASHKVQLFLSRAPRLISLRADTDDRAAAVTIRTAGINPSTGKIHIDQFPEVAALHSPCCSD